MIDLKKTPGGIYYLHDYVGTHYYAYHTDEEVAISRKILDYKNKQPQALEYFSRQLLEAVVEIVKDINTNKIGLIAVPPSKVERNGQSAPHASIELITSWWEKSAAAGHPICDKAIVNYGILLQRATDVSTSHLGPKPSYQEHVDSISCGMDELSKLWTTFIIIDDITTTGRSMKACEDVLVANGAYSKYIRKLVVGHTVHDSLDRPPAERIPDIATVEKYMKERLAAEERLLQAIFGDDHNTREHL